MAVRPSRGPAACAWLLLELSDMQIRKPSGAASTRSTSRCRRSSGRLRATTSLGQYRSGTRPGTLFRGVTSQPASEWPARVWVSAAALAKASVAVGVSIHRQMLEDGTHRTDSNGYKICRVVVLARHVQRPVPTSTVARLRSLLGHVITMTALEASDLSSDVYADPSSTWPSSPASAIAMWLASVRVLAITFDDGIAVDPLEVAIVTPVDRLIQAVVRPCDWFVASATIGPCSAHIPSCVPDRRRRH